MTSLSDAVPRERFSELFHVVDERILAVGVKDYLKNDIESATIVSLYVWDEMVERGRVTNPREMAKYFAHRKLKVYPLVRRTLGREPFRDALSAEFYNEHGRPSYFGRDAEFPFAKFEIVHCYPNDIHLADVTLLDLTRPVREGGQGAPRSHAGLHVLPAFLAGLRGVARSRKATRISLVAASPGAAATFARYGFQPSTAPASSYAAQFVGHGHAMVLPIDG